MRFLITCLLMIFSLQAVAAKTATTKILLSDQAYLDLPKKYEFVTKEKAATIMAAFGNPIDQDFLGLIFPKEDKDLLGWFMVVRFKKVGYINTEVVKLPAAEQTLKIIKEKVAKVNAGTKLYGWCDEPVFDNKKHQFSWGLMHQGRDTKDAVVNEEVFLLGREGVLDISLVTYASLLPNQRPYLEEILGSLHFNQNKSYEAHDVSDGESSMQVVDILTGAKKNKMSLLDWSKKVSAVLLAIVL